jgi:signal transduction histidine kinase
VSTRLLAALILLIVLPLVLLGWISTTALRAEEAQHRRALESLFTQRLARSAIDAQVLLDEMRDELVAQISDRSDLPKKLGDLRRNSPLVQFTFWIDKDGVLLYPEIPDQVDSSRIDDFLGIDELMGTRPQRSVGEAKGVSSQQETAAPIWMPWYRQQGLQLVLWIPGQQGDVVGILVNRAFWISQLIGRLPDSTDGTLGSRDYESQLADAMLTRTRLVDAQSTTVYQWGEGINSVDENANWYALTELPLPGPLSAWKLKHESHQPMTIARSSTLPLVLALFSIGLLLVLLGLYVATSMKRQIHLAAQHVSFAGQVSHELRTPLTNIRLYAEMAQSELERLESNHDAATTSSASETLQVVRRRLSVIEQETQRLSRLCASVLELLKQPHQSRHGVLRPLDVSESIAGIVDQFRPALEKAGVDVVFAVNSERHWSVDREALEMVVMNLLSNVEKYAAAGGWLRIGAEVEAGFLRVRIEDRGPGIPRGKREKIFRPFVRLDSSISAPTGTGIGLSIARQAARRAGGDLYLVPTEVGACFELRMPVE